MNDPDPRSTPADDPLTQRHIEALVERFYAKVRRDPVLGPIFNPAVHDWDEHQRTLVSFWSSVVLKTATYRGNPMAAHRPHPIRGEHFDHWLALWRETALEVMPPAHAQVFVDHATRIGYSLRYGLGLDERHGARSLDIPVVGRDG
ncbi:MAG: group III truncated hemoglobin [Lysobacter sp.]